MRQVREVLRRKHACGQSERQIAVAVGVSRYTVAEYLRRAAVVGITWPVPAGLDDAALEALSMLRWVWFFRTFRAARIPTPIGKRLRYFRKRRARFVTTLSWCP